tara:strand:- start:855 stop:1277 length:423 start_codon:yes stop_codon:yes gene_type:complete
MGRKKTIRMYWDPYKLRCLRRDAGLSKVELAQLIGLPLKSGGSSVARWEKYDDGSSSPRLKSAERLADVFGVRVEDLYSTKGQWELNRVELAKEKLLEEVKRRSVEKRKKLKTELRDRRKKVRSQLKRWAVASAKKEGSQ